MTASESEKKEEPVAETPAEKVAEASDVDRPFVESDGAKTIMTYDKGGLPLYIAVAWVLFIVFYVTVMSLVALPDLKAWMAR